MAESACNSYGANLASIHSDQENDFIIGILLLHILQVFSFLEFTKSGVSGLTNPNTGVWLGLYAAVPKTKFLWTDRSPLDYTKWGAGEPDGWGEDGTILERLMEDIFRRQCKLCRHPLRFCPRL